MDGDGRLVDDIWREGAEPPAEWRRLNVGNCLRESMVQDIGRRSLYHNRNFN